MRFNLRCAVFVMLLLQAFFMSSCAKKRSSSAYMPNSNVVVRFTPTNGSPFEVPVSLGDPAPAMLSLSKYIVENCRPGVGAAGDAPVILGTLEARIGPSKMEAQGKKRNGGGGSDDVKLNFSVEITHRPMSLAQGEPDRFGWIHSGTQDFAPVSASGCTSIPHAAISIPHATQWLAWYFADLITACRTSTFSNDAPLPELERIEKQLRAQEPALAEELARKIRELHHLSDDGRWRYKETPSTGPTVPAAASALTGHVTDPRDVMSAAKAIGRVR